MPTRANKVGVGVSVDVGVGDGRGEGVGVELGGGGNVGINVSVGVGVIVGWGSILSHPAVTRDSINKDNPSTFGIRFIRVYRN